MKPEKKEKPMQLHYYVDYEHEGQLQTQKDIWSSDPGSAMAQCLKSHPGSKIVKAWVEGAPGQLGFGYQEWLPPAVQRELKPEPKPARALKPNERGCEFPFYDEVRSLPPNR